MHSKKHTVRSKKHTPCNELYIVCVQKGYTTYSDKIPESFFEASAYEEAQRSG